MYIIDQESKTPLHVQLYNEIKKKIINKHATGDKLHSIRKVSSMYNLSRNTVESAYSQLVAEGYVESYPKSGYIVTDTTRMNGDINQIPIITQTQKSEDYLYDFFPSRLDRDSFPLKIWKRLFTKVINDTTDFGAFLCGQGELGLRTEIAKYITQFRDVKCQPDQIVITNGFADSMGLLAKIIKNDYNTLAIEDPGYRLALKIFDSFGYKIKKVGLDKNGLRLDLLKKSQAKLVYLTPSHQYPTGVTMPISNRLSLLEWAKEENALLIEDDYHSELKYATRPIPSLQGLNNDDRVVFLGTFSKLLSPSIRISYMVLPNHLLPLYQESFDYKIPRVSLMMQKTLEHFMSEGHWERHIRKTRTLHRKKHNLMKKLLMEKLQDTMKIESEGGGLAIFINPTVEFDWDLLKELAQKNRIKLYFATQRALGEWEAIQMGFGGLKEGEIEDAIELFSKIWKQCIL